MRIRPRVKVFAGQIDPIPLINVVFLLLIFFIISSSLVFQAGIPVELPKAVNPSMSVTDKLVITINRDASDLLFFNDKPVKWDELERELRELVLESKLIMARRAGTLGSSRESARSPLVVLRADRNVPYARVMEVMSLARSLNLGVFLATDLSAGHGGRKPPAPTPEPVD
jgi:biopolymer transport protein ExbD